jgi:hypothetical protein
MHTLDRTACKIAMVFVELDSFGLYADSSVFHEVFNSWLPYKLIPMKNAICCLILIEAMCNF